MSQVRKGKCRDSVFGVTLGAGRLGTVQAPWSMWLPGNDASSQEPLHPSCIWGLGSELASQMLHEQVTMRRAARQALSPTPRLHLLVCDFWGLSRGWFSAVPLTFCSLSLIPFLPSLFPLDRLILLHLVPFPHGASWSCCLGVLALTWG